MNNDTPEKKAVALYYDGENAPELTAIGNHELAQKIIDIAMAHEVPIYENPELVELLARQQLGEKIPPSLYRIVAEIIAFVYHLKGRQPVHSSRKALPYEQN